MDYLAGWGEVENGEVVGIGDDAMVVDLESGICREQVLVFHAPVRFHQRHWGICWTADFKKQRRAMRGDELMENVLIPRSGKKCSVDERLSSTTGASGPTK